MNAPFAIEKQPSRRIGDIEVLAFCDGLLPTANDKVLGLSQEETVRMTGHKFGDVFYMSVNEYLLKIGDKLALIDTGSAERMYPSLGLLIGNLKAAGIDPADIDYIFLTHLHPDHMYGLIDHTGKANFPNAEVFVHEAEANFWFAQKPCGDPRIDKNLPHVEADTRPYRDRLHIVKEGGGITGVAAHLCPGHTPGHTAWIVNSGKDTAIMWGDVVHYAQIQFAKPEVQVAYDLDGAQAARSRRRVLEMCVKDNIRALGAHLPFPGFGWVEKDGSGFRINEAD